MLFRSQTAISSIIPPSKKLKPGKYILFHTKALCKLIQLLNIINYNITPPLSPHQHKKEVCYYTYPLTHGIFLIYFFCTTVCPAALSTSSLMDGFIFSIIFFIFMHYSCIFSNFIILSFKLPLKTLFVPKLLYHT